jgi:hypothetical protein
MSGYNYLTLGPSPARRGKQSAIHQMPIYKAVKKTVCVLADAVPLS